MTHSLVLMIFKNKQKTKKLAWYGRLIAEIFTYKATNVISYTVCIFPDLQDYCFLFYQVYNWASHENNDN